MSRGLPSGSASPASPAARLRIQSASVLQGFVVVLVATCAAFASAFAGGYRAGVVLWRLGLIQWTFALW